MAGIFDNAKKKIRSFVQNIQENKEVSQHVQPTEEDLMVDAEINRRVEKKQTKSDELEVLAYMSDFIGHTISGGKKYWYFCLNEDYRSDEDYADLAQWIFSHNGMQLEKHVSHVDGIEQFVLRMPVEEEAKHQSVITDILLRKNRIHGFQHGHTTLHRANGKMVEVKFLRQEYERATAKLKLKMDKEKAQINNISSGISR